MHAMDARLLHMQVGGCAGRTVEMHGSIKQLVCPDEDCKAVVQMDDVLMARLLDQQHIPCNRCLCQSIRCRIMLYDDKDGALLVFFVLDVTSRELELDHLDRKT